MNNLKKVGLTALGTAMVATSANAATMTVSGGTSIFFGGEDNSNGGNGWSMTDQLDFNASGEMDNGMSLSLYMQLDNSGADFDDRKVTIGMDGHSLVFSGHGSSGPVGAWDDLTPSANEESWGTSIGGSVDGATNAAIGDNSFIYDYTVSDGIALKAAYKPSKGTALQSSTEVGVAYTGMEGLTIKAAMGENNTAADQIDLTVFSVNYAMGPISVGYQANESDRGTGIDEDFTAMGENNSAADQIDLSVFNIKYAMGPITVGYQANESDAGTGVDEDFTAYGISYQVNDDVAVSYGASSLDYGDSQEDQESSAVSVSFTAGGVAMSASHQTTDNVQGTDASDNSSYEINFSFAF